MPARSLIAGWVDSETKARFAAVARAQGLSESALLETVGRRGTVELDTPGHHPIEPVKAPAASGRLSVRVPDAELVLVRERALARDLPVSSYVTFLLRAHLGAAAPLPTAEFDALRRSVLEIAAIGRNLNQITQALNRGARNSGPGVAELHALVLAITRLRENFATLSRPAAKAGALKMKKRVIDLTGGARPLLDIVSSREGGSDADRRATRLSGSHRPARSGSDGQGFGRRSDSARGRAAHEIHWPRRKPGTRK